MAHKAGFVNIIGNPNVGKSTLMNKLVGEKLSIITSKVQTTRDRILGIVNGDDFQIVYSDTPGIIKPAYGLHEKMMSHVKLALEDADIILFVTDVFEEKQKEDEIILKINLLKVPVLLIINKTDLVSYEAVLKRMLYWQELMKKAEIIPVSALTGHNAEVLFDNIIKYLPAAHPYYPKDQLTDKPERFFAAEVIREKIFKNYKKEIPYSTAVNVDSFAEDEKIIRIRAEIIVEKDSQKGIMIGHRGNALKKTGTEARIELEEFLQKKVFLEMHVSVKKDWRKTERDLRNLGYLCTFL